jgi:hypothetical protein
VPDIRRFIVINIIDDPKAGFGRVNDTFVAVAGAKARMTGQLAFRRCACCLLNLKEC